MSQAAGEDSLHPTTAGRPDHHPDRVPPGVGDRGRDGAADDTGGCELRLRPVLLRRMSSGSLWFEELYDLFAPVRAETDEKGYTEEEVNDWIDEAVAAARAERLAAADRSEHG